jgi:hypothetical protein
MNLKEKYMYRNPTRGVGKLYRLADKETNRK